MRNKLKKMQVKRMDFIIKKAVENGWDWKKHLVDDEKASELISVVGSWLGGVACNYTTFKLWYQDEDIDGEQIKEPGEAQRFINLHEIIREPNRGLLKAIYGEKILMDVFELEGENWKIKARDFSTMPLEEVINQIYNDIK